ncbi:GNAT family protein [Novosphingobium sp. RD2P27]|uniref:GNAT family protein n=1 Tax=Novosphingobium kalidii TaxID=3230299 RepID=A0ABV2D524_9SPHN
MQEKVKHVPPSVLIREACGDDLPLLFALRCNLALQSLLLTVPDALDDAALQTWIARRQGEPGGLFRMVEDAVSGEAVGFVQVAQVHRRNRNGYLGISLTENARGRGLGQAALRELLHVSRHELGLHKGLVEVRVDNVAALHAHLQVGFRIIGTLSSHFIDATGAAHDVLLLEHMLEGVI